MAQPSPCPRLLCSGAPGREGGRTVRTVCPKPCAQSSRRREQPRRPAAGSAARGARRHRPGRSRREFQFCICICVPGVLKSKGGLLHRKQATVTKRALGVAEASGAACAAPGLAGSGPLTTCWAARSLGGGTRRGLRNSPSAPRLFHVLKLMDFNSFYKDGMRFDSRVTRGPRRARRVCRLLRCAAARPGEGGLAPRVTPLPDGHQLSRSLFW